jgi:predicted signal transduction protein with EAL and GGDEF domain
MISVGFPDLYKHMVLTNVLLALGLPVMVACCWVRVDRWRARGRDPAPADLGTR